jgi:hypothetical protein
MNLIGKIFTVAILVLSLVFMSLAMAVYATHTNWLDKVKNPTTGCNAIIAKKVAEAKKLNDTIKDLQESITRDQAQHNEAIKMLQSEKERLTGENKRLQLTQAELTDLQVKTVTALKAAQDNTTKFRAELELIRTSLSTSRAEAVKIFAELRTTSVARLEAEFERKQLAVRATEMADDLKKYTDMVLYLNPGKNLENYKGTAPRDIQTKVSAVEGGGLCEISLGSDSGIKAGHVLEVYRSRAGKTDFVGRVNVILVESNKAVCKAEARNLRSNIQVNDLVLSPKSN